MEVFEAPEHFSQEAKDIWHGLIQEFGIRDVAGLKILKVACECYMRAQGCREIIEKDGPVVLDRFHKKKPHPLLAPERDAKNGFLAALKALNLDLEPVGAVGRPPGQGRGEDAY